jgi:hypothetical protein
VRLDDVEVLEHGIGGAAVPVLLVDALLGGQQVDELVHLRLHETPAALHVAQQAVRLVLGDHADAADVGIEAVRQREVDDAELAAEVHRRLGPRVGQFLEPTATAAGQHQCERATGQLRAIEDLVGHDDLPGLVAMPSLYLMPRAGRVFLRQESTF